MGGCWKFLERTSQFRMNGQCRNIRNTVEDMNGVGVLVPYSESTDTSVEGVGWYLENGIGKREGSTTAVSGY